MNLYRTFHSFLRGLVASMIVGTSVVATSVVYATGESPAEETVLTGETLMIIGYLILWLMVGGFLAAVLLRQRAMKRDVDDLEERLDGLVDQHSENTL